VDAITKNKQGIKYEKEILFSVLEWIS